MFRKIIGLVGFSLLATPSAFGLDTLICTAELVDQQTEEVLFTDTAVGLKFVPKAKVLAACEAFAATHDLDPVLCRVSCELFEEPVLF